MKKYFHRTVLLDKNVLRLLIFSMLVFSEFLWLVLPFFVQMVFFISHYCLYLNVLTKFPIYLPTVNVI